MSPKPAPFTRIIKDAAPPRSFRLKGWAIRSPTTLSHKPRLFGFQAVSRLVLAHLKTKELMNRVERRRVRCIDNDPATPRSLFESVTDVSLQALHHRDAIRNFVMHR